MSKLLGYLGQRFSLHDGSGIRSTLFLKGCPLSCVWCQNPESISSKEEMSFNINNCIGCGICENVCDFEAIDLSSSRRIDLEKCVVCGECADNCPNVALEKIGWEKSVEDIADELLRDESFYACSGGGVTISGGEPLLQSKELGDLLQILKNKNIHTLIETSAHVPWRRFEEVIEYCDEFFIDLKSSKEMHEELTGVKQEDYIIPNIKRLKESHPEVKVTLRIPIVPGMNDGEEVIDSISKVMKEELGHEEIEILQFHRMYESKIENLIHTDQQVLGISPSDDSIFSVHERFSQNGIISHLPEELEEQTEFVKPKMTDRVKRIYDIVKYGEFEICTERVKNLTNFYKNVIPKEERKDKSKSQIVRAKMLDYLLENKAKIIYEDELIIGNYASKRVSGNLYMELHGLGVVEDLLNFKSRETNPWDMSMSDFWDILKTIPFWVRNNIFVDELGIFEFLKLANRLMKGHDFVLNEAGGFVHFCPGYERILGTGTTEIILDAKKRKSETDVSSKRDFYDSVVIVCEALEKLSESYAKKAEKMAKSASDEKRREELLGIAKTCRRIPYLQPTNLQEALQCIVLYQLAMFQEAIDLGIAPGRLDIVLYPYYKMTKEQGLINDEEIFELLCCFWLKLGEVVPLFNDRITNVHGGLFNGQTINVGGIDANGGECTNELSYIFLEVADAMRTRMPNFYFRYNESTTKPELLQRASRMIRDGAAMPAMSNDPIVIDMLTKDRDMKVEDARDYILLGCVEPVIPGKTYYSTDASLTNLPLCLERSIHYLHSSIHEEEDNSDELLPKDMEDMFNLYQQEVELLVTELLEYGEKIEHSLKNYAPTPLTSVCLDGCIESGTDASSGGTVYNGSGHQGIGAADVTDSLSAMEHIVYVEEKCSLEELLEAVVENFESERGQVIRGYLLQAPKYGNDDFRADKWMTRVMKGFSDILTKNYNLRGGKHCAGWYSVTIHDTFGRNVGALPSGRLANQPFSSGMSPTSGSVKEGPTATLKSAANIDIMEYSWNGVNLNLMLQDSYLKGEKGVQTVENLVRGYFNGDPKGIQVQFNVMDPEILKDARDNPSKYPDLLVRVSGYSAYFRDLSPMVRDEIVQRYCKESRL